MALPVCQHYFFNWTLPQDFLLWYDDKLQEKIVSAGILGEGEMCEEDYINIGGYTWHLTPDDHKVELDLIIYELII